MSATVVSLYAVLAIDHTLVGHYTSAAKAKAAVKRAPAGSITPSGPTTVPAIRVPDGTGYAYYLLASSRPVAVDGKRSQEALIASAKAKLDPDEFAALSAHLSSE